MNPIPTVPWSATAPSQIKQHELEEIPSIFGRYFLQNWVVAGGLHDNSATCLAHPVALEAFGGGKIADRITATSDNNPATAFAIDYTTISGCPNPGAITCTTIASAQSGNTIGNFHRNGSSNYFVNCTDAAPATLPDRSAMLMTITITNGAIVGVTDKRVLSPLGTSATPPPFDIEALLGVTLVSLHATGGTGTTADPWTGWESVFTQSFGRHFIFGPGIFQTSTPLALTGHHPMNVGLGGYMTIEGSGDGASIIMWQPTGATPTETVSATGDAGMTTWLTIGALNLQSQNVVLRNLKVGSTDTTYKKRAFHIIDCRSCVFEKLSVAAPGSYWLDTTHKSIGFHIEGRGQLRIVHLTLTTDYPMILDGTPNEGGACYSTDAGWTGSQGACEFDTSTVEDVSLSVTHGTGITDAIPARAWVAHANLRIGSPAQLNRTIFRRIDCSGGTYCIAYHHTAAVAFMGSNLFEGISWEDPCPLDPTILGAGRLAAGVSATQMVPGNPYGDNAALQPSAAWGYMIALDMDDNPAGMYGVTLSNISSQKGGNTLSLHHIFMVTIQGLKPFGQGALTQSYPGELGTTASGPFPADANKPIDLDISGNRLSSPYTSYPVVCISCMSSGFNTVAVSADLDVVISTPVDPIGYLGVGHVSPFPSSALTVWDSVKDTNPSGADGIHTFTPRLVDSQAPPNEATYTHRSGVVTQQTINGKKLLTFSAYIDVAGTGGMTGTDVAVVRNTDGDVWGTAWCPTADCNTNPFFYTLSVGLTSNLTLHAGYTSVTARIQGGDDRVFLSEIGSGVSSQNVLVSAITAGTVILVGGSFVIP